MREIPLTICLFTSTLGHFGQKDRYRQTVDGLESLWPLRDYADRIAHIKVSPEDVGPGKQAEVMVRYLEERGFRVFQTVGSWGHGQQSHQSEYLRDMERIYSLPIFTSYVWAVEDDWSFWAQDWLPSLYSAITLLEKDPDVMQIRLPRWVNEPNRINNLMAKHGLNRSAIKIDDLFWACNDFSANPSIFRTRDIRAAVKMTRKLNVPQHVEHGLGEVLRLLSSNPLPFCFFNPSFVRVGHTGTRPGEEDDLDKPLYAD